MTQRVGIVGAGLAGLSAARALIDAGAEVTVFDKGRRPGGRANTREHAKYRFDHGAQYFTAQGDALAERLEEWRRDGVVQEWHGTLVYIDGDEVSDATPANRWVAVPGMVDLALHLARGLDVRSGVRIGDVRPHADSWTLVDSEGGEHQGFDRVLLAVPAPQAVPLLAAVPHLQAAARSVTMDPCWAVMLAFVEPLDVPFDGAFVRGRDLSWIARDSSKPGRPDGAAWVVHFGPEWTQEHWEDRPEDVVVHALGAMEGLIGGLPDVDLYRAHRWGYALASGVAGGILYSPSHGIGACGDWCVGGRVEGAIASGLEIARHLSSDASHGRREPTDTRSPP